MKKDHQTRYLELFSSTSTNFIGTGLTMQQFMDLNTAEKVENAWFRQERDERKRRLNFVMELSVELARIKETLFSIGLAEAGIEGIIDGDWKMVKEWADHFMFEDESEEIRQRYASVFARVRELLQQAYDTRPGQMDVKA